MPPVDSTEDEVFSATAAVSRAAILAGAVVAPSASLIIQALGTGLGLSAISLRAHRGFTPRRLEYPASCGWSSLSCVPAHWAVTP